MDTATSMDRLRIAELLREKVVSTVVGFGLSVQLEPFNPCGPLAHAYAVVLPAADLHRLLTQLAAAASQESLRWQMMLRSVLDSNGQ
jgi:hypothetical protein